MKTRSELFDAKWIAEPNTGCHIWIAAMYPEGYGEFRYGTPTRTLPAHRFSYDRKYGPIPSGMVTDHICRVRCCVNPDHLRIVTVKQNSVENSNGAAAKNAMKKTCKRGHAFTDENTRRRRIGRRECIQCTRIISNLGYRRRHTEALAQAECEKRNWK